MPIRVPRQTIVLVRNNERVIPKIGVPFDFTAKELDDINAVNPAAVRKPVQEVEVPAAAPAKAAKTQKPAPQTPAADGADDAGGGNDNGAGEL